MYRLRPCIPILGFFVLIKNTKKMCICEYVIFSIDTCEKCFLSLKKGISKFSRQVAPKHTAGSSDNNLALVNSFILGSIALP